MRKSAEIGRLPALLALAISLVASLALLGAPPAQATPSASVGWSGTAQVGQTLTALPSNLSCESFSIKWTATTGIGAAGNVTHPQTMDTASGTGETYTPTPADVGHQMMIEVFCSGGSFAEAVGWTSTVLAGDFTPGDVTITGTGRVGQTLTVDTGTWTPTPNFSYQWRRDASNITGATSRTYTLVAADHGTRLSVVVTASLDGYNSYGVGEYLKDVIAGKVDAGGVTISSLRAGVPVVSSGCVSVAVTAGYRVSSESASTITKLSATAQVRNSSGTKVGTVALTSTDTALSGVASGTFTSCSAAATGKLTISGLRGSYTGVFTSTPAWDTKVSEQVGAAGRSQAYTEDVSGTFRSSLTVSATGKTAVKQTSTKFTRVKAFKNHTTRTFIGKVVIYSLTAKRWVALKGRPKVVLQKLVKGVWVKVLTTKATKAAWLKASWTSKTKATYRLVKADNAMVVSRTFTK